MPVTQILTKTSCDDRYNIFQITGSNKPSQQSNTWFRHTGVWNWWFQTAKT